MSVVSYLGENKEPHTTVDYLDDLIQKAYDRAMFNAKLDGVTEQERNKQEENSLKWTKKRIIKKLGAKSFSELSAAEQARYRSTS